MRRACSDHYKPSFKDAPGFGEGVWAWWRLLAPLWVVKGDATEKRVAVDVRPEEWKAIDVTGSNGFLGVLICLSWWADAAKNSPGESWLALVQEVHTVLQQLSGYVSSLFDELKQETEQLTV